MFCSFSIGISAPAMRDLGSSIHVLGLLLNALEGEFVQTIEIVAVGQCSRPVSGVPHLALPSIWYLVLAIIPPAMVPSEHLWCRHLLSSPALVPAYRFGLSVGVGDVIHPVCSGPSFPSGHLWCRAHHRAGPTGLHSWLLTNTDLQAGSKPVTLSDGSVPNLSLLSHSFTLDGFLILGRAFTVNWSLITGICFLCGEPAR